MIFDGEKKGRVCWTFGRTDRIRLNSIVEQNTKKEMKKNRQRKKKCASKISFVLSCEMEAFPRSYNDLWQKLKKEIYEVKACLTWDRRYKLLEMKMIKMGLLGLFLLLPSYLWRLAFCDCQ